MQEIRKKSIAVLTGNCSINEENDAVRGICKTAKKAGWNVFIFDAMNNFLQDDKPVSEISIFSLLNFQSVSGVIITQNVMNVKELGESLIAKCIENNIPVISLGYKTASCHSIVYANSDYLEQIVDHVIEKHGCKTLNLVAGIENNIFSENRIKAFKRSLKNHGLTFDKKRMFYGQFWEMPTREGMNKFFESGLSLPDAFICCNDMMAMTVCAELSARGYSIPDDVIVTGYDGVEFEHYSNPRLTTAKCDYETLAVFGFESLLKLIDGKKVPKLQTMKPDLLFSESCGCVRKYKHQHNLAMKAMNSIGSLRYINTLSYKLAASASYAGSLKQLRHILPGKGFYNPNCWVLLNHGYDSLKAKNPYNSKNPYSDYVDCFLVSHFYEHYYDIPPIRKSMYIPNLREVLESGVTNLLFINLSFGEENIGYLVTSFDDSDVSLIGMENFAQGLSQSLSTLKFQSQLEYMTIRDMLTGIYNRRGFFSEMTARIQQTDMSSKKNLIIFSIDMDELKYINDTFGHLEGDYAIKKMAEAITKAGGSDAINSRFGGDEFVSAIISKEKADKVINDFKTRLILTLSEINEKSGKPYTISTSVGAKSTTIGSATKIEKIIAKADELMYSDKASKKRSHPRS